MIKVVITGASGFLGSHLLKKLENDTDCFVYALSSKTIVSNADNVKSFHKDIIDSDCAEEIFCDAVVVNCAFPRNAMGSEMAAGLEYINKLFKTCKICKSRAIINISSQSVYSQKRNCPANESTDICLESPYAVGKYATELLLQNICEGTEIAYTNLRLSSLIGPGFDQRVVNRIVEKGISGETIMADISDKRFGFLDVLDAVDGILTVAKSNVFHLKPVYNLGNGAGYSIKDFCDCIQIIFESKGLERLKVEYNESKDFGTTAVLGDLLKDDFGFIPSVTLTSSINEIVNDKLIV